MFRVPPWGIPLNFLYNLLPWLIIYWDFLYIPCLLFVLEGENALELGGGGAEVEGERES